MGAFFNNSFKTNPSLGRALLTGITRICKESIFSDLNNIDVVTQTSTKYETAFGFTEEEVKVGLARVGLLDYREKVKEWYDGFTFGQRRDMYNRGRSQSLSTQRGSLIFIGRIQVIINW